MATADETAGFPFDDRPAETPNSGVGPIGQGTGLRQADQGGFSGGGIGNAARTDLTAEANRIIAELLGPDRNWERLFAFLADRHVMALGASSGVDTLEELWAVLTTQEPVGAVGPGRGRQINLSDSEGRQEFRKILENPVVFERQFGNITDPAEREAVITAFIEQVMGKTNFVVINEMLDQVLMAQLDPTSDANRAILDQLADTGMQGEAVGMHFVPTFDGTPSGTITSVGDLVAGLSINPQDIQRRIARLSTEELAAVQLGLWRYGYFTADDGSVEQFSFGEQGTGAYDPTYNALARMIFDLLEKQNEYGPDYSIDSLLTDRQVTRAKEMAVQYSGTNKAQNEKRALRDQVGREVGQLLIGTGQTSGALAEALALAEEESGVKLTAKGRKVLQGHLAAALDEHGMTEDELEAAYQQNRIDDDVEMMLAAFYTGGTFTGDWTENVVIGANTDADWAQAGLMAGVITEAEARTLLAGISPQTDASARQSIRKKLEDNAAEIARTSMKWWVQNSTFAGGGPAGMGSEFDMAAAFRGYGAEAGRVTAQQNQYDRLTYERLLAAMHGSVGDQWLLDERAGQIDYAGDIADRVTESAVGALGLPDRVDAPFGVGGIRSVLNAITGTGTRSMRRG